MPGALPAVAAIVLAAVAEPPLVPAAVADAASAAANGLRTVTRRLAADDFEGRDNGSRGSAAAQRYLVRRLRRLGHPPAGGRAPAGHRQPFTESGQRGTNLLALVPGRERPDEIVVVAAHYDALGTRGGRDGTCARDAPPGGAVCPGATDNAAGVAAVLGIGRALSRLPQAPRRSVLVALFDAEEDGLLGSRHWIANPLVPGARVVASVHYDIVGQNLLPGLDRTSFAIGAETGGEALRALVAAAARDEPLALHALGWSFGQERSDARVFVGRGVPSVFLTDGDGPCYHTTGDVPAIVDFRKLAAQARIGFRLVAALAEMPEPPVFAPPSRDGGTWDDAVALAAVLDAAEADVARLPEDERAIVERAAAGVAAVVRAGAANVERRDRARLLAYALDVAAAVRRLPCVAGSRPDASRECRGGGGSLRSRARGR